MVVKAAMGVSNAGIGVRVAVGGLGMKDDGGRVGKGTGVGVATVSVHFKL
jgi:hypothetical protein